MNGSRRKARPARSGGRPSPTSSCRSRRTPPAGSPTTARPSSARRPSSGSSAPRTDRGTSPARRAAASSTRRVSRPAGSRTPSATAARPWGSRARRCRRRRPRTPSSGRRSSACPCAGPSSSPCDSPVTTTRLRLDFMRRLLELDRVVGRVAQDVAAQVHGLLGVVAQRDGLRARRALGLDLHDPHVGALRRGDALGRAAAVLPALDLAADRGGEPGRVRVGVGAELGASALELRLREQARRDLLVGP